jgi:hypothetical protein
MCKRAFVADDPKTSLQRPFPPMLRILWHLILTTIITVGVAMAAAFFQTAAASGH